MEIVGQGVFLAESYGIVKQTAANDLHHSLYLLACEDYPALTKDSEDRCMTDLNFSAWASAALHSSRVNYDV
jgi:hypothetical protein